MDVLVVDIDEVLRVKAYLANINKEELETIEFISSGKDIKYDIGESVYLDWKFMGLDNTDFIDFLPGVN